MKKSIQIALVAAGLLLVGNTVSAQQKLGHINSGELLQALPEVKVADAGIQAFAKGKQAALEQMESERQKKILAYQDKAKTVSEANKEAVEKELAVLAKEVQDIMQRIDETQQKVQDELATKRRETYQPIIKKIEDAIRVIAKERGYAYVFDIAQPGVVYFDGGDDLLTPVKAKLGISASVSPPAPALKK